MIYTSNENVKLKAFQWGVDEPPLWINYAEIEHANILFIEPILKIRQPGCNPGSHVISARLMDFIVLTEEGLFQVYSPKQFLNLLFRKAREPVLEEK